jgi:hypothetical protein
VKPRSRQAPPFLAIAAAVVLLNQLLSSGDFVEAGVQLLPSSVAAELVLLVLIFALVARTTRPPLLLWPLAACLLALFALRALSIGVPWFFGRDLNVAVDSRFVPVFAKLLYDSTPPVEFAFLAAATIVGVLLAVLLVRAALATLWRAVVLRGWWGIAAGSALVVAGWAAVPGAPSTPDPRPPVSFDAGRALYAAADSVLRAEGLRGEHRARIDAAQAALPATSTFPKLAGRNVVLVFVESYGSVTAREPAFAAALDPLRARLDARLEAAGFARATALLRSPITGGGSWMAHGTLMAGVRLAAQDAYEVMLVSGARTLAHRLADAGYRTVALMPRIDQPWPEGRLLGFDALRLQPDLGYAGPRFAWESLPDQWVLDRFARTDYAPAPLFAKIVLASSHTPFERVPPLVDDWSKLGDPRVYAALPASEFPVRRGQVFEQDEGYRAAVAYSLEAAVRFAAERTDDETLFIVMGDHQPPLTTARRTGDFSVPVHVFSRAAELVAPFRARGYAEGLAVPPGGALAGMEDFLAGFLSDFGGSR